MNLIILGAVAMACICASLFFLRFWKTTHDRFFLFFSAAFCIEGVNRVLQGMLPSQDELEPLVYLVRLFAFLIILYAIIDKNWLRKSDKS